MNIERWIFGSALALFTALSVARAEDPPATMDPTSDRAQEVFYGEPVDRVYAPNIRSWQAVDGQRLVVYVTAFRPYLITLRRKANALKWEDRIGFDNRTGYLDARFDRIYVDGFPYQISRIEKITRDTAKLLLRKDKDKAFIEAQEEEAEKDG